MRSVLPIVCFTFCFCTMANAQLWTGSLGPPIISITFGDGYNTPLAPNFTSYQQGGMCPGPGQYGIGGKSFSCNDANGVSRNWLRIIGDHYFPGDVAANFMIVNAEGTPGTVFSDTATDLCANATYQFAAWITNVLQINSCNGSPELAKLSFNVSTLSGILLATYSTGDIPIKPEKEWDQFGFTFKTPADVDAVVLTITTNPHNRCGSVFAIDDITLNECGPKIISTINGSTDPLNVCANYINTLTLETSYGPGYSDPVLQWQSSLDSGVTWNNIIGAISFNYQIPHRSVGTILYRTIIAERPNINSANCWTISNIIYTSVHPQAPHLSPQDFMGCTSKDLYMPKPDPFADSIEWIGPNGYFSSSINAILPNVQYNDTGLYERKQFFSYGCSSLDTFYLKIFPGTTLTTQPPYPLCEGMSETLYASGTGGGKYKWVPPTGLSNDTIANPVVTPAGPIEYKLYYTNSYGCQDSAYFDLRVYKNPKADAGPGKIILRGDSVTLNGSAEGSDIEYYWSPSVFMDDSSSLMPIINPSYDVLYTLHVVSTVGCGEVSSGVQIKVYDDIYIPNAFTPNGDGKNDKFHVLALDDYQLGSFTIYNRWGRIVFKGSNTADGWDGTFNGLPQPTGAYVYYLELKNNAGKKIFKKGTLLLVR
jgi:gliding motility-associated-like protein